MSQKKARSAAWKASRRIRWKDPETRARRCTAMSIAAKRKYEKPVEREKTANAIRRAYQQNPVYKKKNAEHLASIHEARRGSAREAGGLCKSPEYKIWDAMVRRCTNPKNASFKNYGGRGIQVCPEWTGRGGFLRFYAYIGPRPSSDLTVDRINNNGSYEPGNVRWTTRKIQSHNSRKVRLVKIQDEALPLAEWARRIGVTAPTLIYRLDQGWPEDRLLRPGRKRR